MNFTNRSITEGPHRATRYVSKFVLCNFTRYGSYC